MLRRLAPPAIPALFPAWLIGLVTSLALRRVSDAALRAGLETLQTRALILGKVLKLMCDNAVGALLLKNQAIRCPYDGALVDPAGARGLQFRVVANPKLFA